MDCFLVRTHSVQHCVWCKSPLEVQPVAQTSTVRILGAAVRALASPWAALGQGLGLGFAPRAGYASIQYAIRLLTLSGSIARVMLLITLYVLHRHCYMDADSKCQPDQGQE
eukprot:TRINITY_DN11581_c0_g1_i1.p1 TRINITY_DN11581_c0_g1~~TRINITY_DN11581_c0_g1_i1.p1  ORF type:complete len:111 (-),score=6.11 TRINITY_DN11581_c0_g1_i1:124-456(-)